MLGSGYVVLGKLPPVFLVVLFFADIVYLPPFFVILRRLYSLARGTTVTRAVWKSQACRAVNYVRAARRHARPTNAHRQCLQPAQHQAAAPAQCVGFTASRKSLGAGQEALIAISPSSRASDAPRQK